MHCEAALGDRLANRGLATSTDTGSDSRVGQSALRCVAGGYAANADVAGALNIRTRGLDVLYLEAA